MDIFFNQKFINRKKSLGMVYERVWYTLIYS